MRILVTGGLGVIGSCFCRSALSLGHSVTVLDSCEEPRNEWNASWLSDLGVRVRKERMESADLAEALDHDLVVHAAAFTGIPSSADRPDDDWVSNVDATRRLLDVLRSASSPPPTVVLSSVKPYRLDAEIATYAGPSLVRYGWSPGVACSEDWPLDPDEPYAASKMAQSAVCVAYARTYGLPLVVFRCSNLYGPGPCHGPRHGWLTWFCISAAIGRPIVIQGDGMQSRDMLHADDVTSAVFCALGSMESVRGRLYNIGGGAPNVISVREAALELQGLAGGTPVNLAYGQGRKFEDLAFVTDHGRFTAATGWTPQVGVTHGLRSVYEWAVQNRDALAGLYEGV